MKKLLNLVLLAGLVLSIASCEKEVIEPVIDEPVIIDPTVGFVIPPDWTDPMVGDIVWLDDVTGSWNLDRILSRTFEFSTGESTENEEVQEDCQFVFIDDTQYEFVENGAIVSGSFEYDFSSLIVEHILDNSRAVIVEISPNTLIFCYNIGDEDLAANRLYYLSR